MSTRSEIRDRWRSILRQQQASGLSVSAFCRRAGVLPSGFFKWRRKLAGVTTFAEVQLRPVARSPRKAGVVPSTGEIELRLPGRRSIVVPRGFDRPTLIELLDILEVGSADIGAREVDR